MRPNRHGLGLGFLGGSGSRVVRVDRDLAEIVAESCLERRSS
jgi:hypothetical protein